MSSLFYQEMLDRLAEWSGVTLRTEILGESGLISEGIIKTLEPAAPSADGAALRPALSRTGDHLCLREPLLPQERLIILGGGHIALPLCEFSARCGFRVFVVDDRPDFANTERFPQATGVLCDSFVSAIAALHITAQDYVVIITRGHAHDADCLRAVLPGTTPAYLGMIGSRRRVAALLSMLRDEGYDPSRVCTPIGLKIGAVTPEEIAVSILSEVISYRRLPEKNDIGRLVNASDLELEVIEYLASHPGPKAVVTVIDSEGSSPRGPGAKMVVSLRGQVIGSVGGGWGEGKAIREALGVIGTGRYLLSHIDMTNDVAARDGMACGGHMTLLIEDGTS